MLPFLSNRHPNTGQGFDSFSCSIPRLEKSETVPIGGVGGVVWENPGGGLSQNEGHTHHLSHTRTHTTLSHTHTIFLCHTPSFTYNFVTHNSSYTPCFTSRSSTTSFVFPSFPVPATTFVAHYWKKLLISGVIRSFNFSSLKFVMLV